MIFIKKVSKKNGIEKINRYSVSEAIMIIYGLSRMQMKISEYYFVGGTTLQEQNEILRYFSDEYLVKNDSGLFPIYRIKEDVQKKNRIRECKFNPTTLIKIENKVREELENTGVIIGSDGFSIYGTHEETRFKFDFDNNMKLYNIDVVKDGVLVEELTKEMKELKTRINGILTKQRYYYKKADKKVIYKEKRTGDVYEGDPEELVYVSQLEGFIHSDDVKEVYSDDTISDISIYEGGIKWVKG